VTSSFEDRLWTELVREHGEKIRTAPRATAMLAASVAAPDSSTPRVARRRLRRPALLTGTALGTAGVATAAVLALTATTSAPAFAVTDNADGTVTVTLKHISAISALNAELAHDAIPAKAVPLTATCPTRGVPHYMPAGTNPSTYTITIVPREIPAGYTAVLAASEHSSGQVELLQGAVPSPAPACFNSAVPVFHRRSATNLTPAIRAQTMKARTAARAAHER
jgi:hypothetical protein